MLNILKKDNVILVIIIIATITAIIMIIVIILIILIVIAIVVKSFKISDMRLKINQSDLSI